LRATFEKINAPRALTAEKIEDHLGDAAETSATTRPAAMPRFLATNRPEKMDSAIKRRGRFDFQIEVNHPTARRLVQYLKDMPKKSEEFAELDKLDPVRQKVKDAVLRAVEKEFKDNPDREIRFTWVEELLKNQRDVRAIADLGCAAADNGAADDFHHAAGPAREQRAGFFLTVPLTVAVPPLAVSTMAPAPIVVTPLSVSVPLTATSDMAAIVPPLSTLPEAITDARAAR
jgi:hypothetical protein